MQLESFILKDLKQLKAFMYFLYFRNALQGTSHIVHSLAFEGQIKMFLLSEV